MTAGRICQLCRKIKESLLDAHARWALGRDSHLQSGVLRLLGGTGLPSISAARTPSCTMSSTTPLAARRIPLCADAFVRLSVCCSHHREASAAAIEAWQASKCLQQGVAYCLCAGHGGMSHRLGLLWQAVQEPQRQGISMQSTWMAGGLSVKSLSSFPGDTGSFPVLSWSCPLD